GAWVAAEGDPAPYLQVDLGYAATVTALATQGRPGSAGAGEGEGEGGSWATGYKLLVSDDGEGWREAAAALEGNSDGASVVTHRFDPGLGARFLRVCPTGFHGAPALRAEVFAAPLGAALLAPLPDNAFRATSQADAHHGAHAARLHGAEGKGGWCPDLPRPRRRRRLGPAAARRGAPGAEGCYLEVDLGSGAELAALAVQGQAAAAPMRGGGGGSDLGWVTRFAVEASAQEGEWERVSPPGGFEVPSGLADHGEQVSTFVLASPTMARRFRVRPLEWHHRPVLRLQAFGRPVGAPLGLQSEAIGDDQLTASS
ncbi:unnamed protein product, partial [Heterosigma akashiwo]